MLCQRADGPVAISFGISASHGAMIDFNDMLDTASFVLEAQKRTPRHSLAGSQNQGAARSIAASRV